MDTLLNRLKERDKKLHQEIVSDLLQLGDHRNNFIICGKLQEAIRARGWIYMLDCQPTGVNRCGAGVKDGNKWLAIRNADTEAEALLKAYLAALNEVKK